MVAAGHSLRAPLLRVLGYADNHDTRRLAFSPPSPHLSLFKELVLTLELVSPVLALTFFHPHNFLISRGVVGGVYFVCNDLEYPWP